MTAWQDMFRSEWSSSTVRVCLVAAALVSPTISPLIMMVTSGVGLPSVASHYITISWPTITPILSLIAPSTTIVTSGGEGPTEIVLMELLRPNTLKPYRDTQVFWSSIYAHHSIL